MLETSDRLCQMVAVTEIDLGEHRGDSRRRPRQALRLVYGKRLPEQRSRLLAASAPPGHPPRTVVECRPLERVVRQLGRLLEVTLRLAPGAERRRALARPREHLPRLRLDLLRIVGVGRRVVRVEVVRGDDLDDLFLLGERRL